MVNRNTKGGRYAPGVGRFVHSVAYRFPVAVILGAFVLACLGGYLYFRHLPLISNRGTLSNEELEINRRYQQYRAEFGGDQKLLILMASAEPGAESDSLPPPPTPEQRAAMKNVAARWAQRLEQRPDLFPQVTARIPPDEIGPLALLYASLETVETLSSTLESQWPHVEAFAASPSLSTLFGTIGQELERAAPPASPGEGRQRWAAALDGLEGLMQWTDQELRTDADTTQSLNALWTQTASLLNRGSFDADGYLFTAEGRLLTAYAAVTEMPSQRNAYGPALAYAEEALRQALSEAGSVHIEAGMAGKPALEYVETLASQRDFARSAILALVLVSLLFMWSFRSLVHPAMAVLCLGFSIGITFIAAWLFIGHLNMLVMVFAVILVALGIDFAIHFYTHYQHARLRSETPEAAIRETYQTVGGALWAGGLTTVAAFLSASVTEFSGLSELGLVAGAGLFICLACMYFVFPAMLYLLDTWTARRQRPAHRTFANELISSVAAERGGARRVLIAGLIALAGAGYLTGQYTFDTNLLNLQPVDSPAYQWQRLLLDADDRTSFAIGTYENREELERARAAFQGSPLVRRTESIFPAREAEKRALLAPACSSMTALRVAPVPNESVQNLRRRLFRIRQTVRRYRRTEAASEALADLERVVDDLYRTLQALPEAVQAERVSHVSGVLRQAFSEAKASAEELLCPPPFAIEKVPPPLKARLLGDQGTLALVVYPEQNTWERRHMEAFVEELRRIDSRIFGGVVNFYENAQSLIRSFVYAALYATVAILALLLFWTRSVRDTLLAMLPLALGVGVLLGVMRWSPEPIYWHFANFFALPILIGIGVDSGVHLLRAWKDPQHETFKGAVAAVLVSCLTTMIGFGLLALGAHRGVASLGLIVFVGITSILAAALLVAPAALRRFLPKKALHEDQEVTAQEEADASIRAA